MAVVKYLTINYHLYNNNYETGYPKVVSTGPFSVIKDQFTFTLLSIGYSYYFLLQNYYRDTPIRNNDVKYTTNFYSNGSLYTSIESYKLKYKNVYDGVRYCQNKWYTGKDSTGIYVGEGDSTYTISITGNSYTLDLYCALSGIQR